MNISFRRYASPDVICTGPLASGSSRSSRASESFSSGETPTSERLGASA